MKKYPNKLLILFTAILMLISMTSTKEVFATTETGTADYEDGFGDLHFFSIYTDYTHIAYCAEQKNPDNMQNVTYYLSATKSIDYENESGNYRTNWRNEENHWEDIKRILYVGYDNDAKGYGTGYTPEQFRIATQEAIWYFTDTYMPTEEKTLAEMLIYDETVVPYNYTLKFWKTDERDTVRDLPYQSLFTLQEILPGISTVVKYDGTSSTSAAPVEAELEEGEDLKFFDTITLSDLVVNEEYTIIATVYSTSYPDTPVIDSSRQKFTADAETKNIEMSFTIPSGTWKYGETYSVIVQLLDSDEKTISTHNGKLDDNLESIKVKKDSNTPNISNTTVTYEEVKSTANKPVDVVTKKHEEVTFKDTVVLKNLDANKEYQVETELYPVGADIEKDSFVAFTSVSVKGKDAKDGELSIDIEIKDFYPDEKGVYSVVTTLYEINGSDYVEVAKHNKNLEDKQESINVILDPVATTVGIKKVDEDEYKYSGDGFPTAVTLQKGEDSGNFNVVDKIDYSGLPTGRTYEITSYIYEVKYDDETYERSKGALIKQVGPNDFDVESAQGVWEVDFGEVNLKAGQYYVSHDFKIVGDKVDTEYFNEFSHDDVNDYNQTFVVQGYYDLIVAKRWDDEFDKAGARPSKITIKFNDGKTTRTLTFNEKDADFNSSFIDEDGTKITSWLFMLESPFPLVDEDGKEIKYSISESSIPNYECVEFEYEVVVVDDEPNAIVFFENKYTPKKKDYTIPKTGVE